MQDIRLDITPFEEKISLHRYLKENLGFPFYYGANLDALFDELSSITEPTHITLCYSIVAEGEMHTYTARLLHVFGDAAQQNYNIKLTVKARD